jgi:hypothetical protein
MYQSASKLRGGIWQSMCKGLCFVLKIFCPTSALLKSNEVKIILVRVTVKQSPGIPPVNHHHHHDNLPIHHYPIASEQKGITKS